MKNLKIILVIGLLIITLFSMSGQIFGKLSISGSKLVNATGTTVQLTGMSSMGLQWYPFCTTTVDNLVSSWGVTVVRAANYTAEEGYIDNPTTMKAAVKTIVDSAIRNNIYVLIDWHILSDGNPLTYKTQAIAFFQEMATTYGNYNHVIYEICNEPNGVDWTTIKTYATEVINAIRAIDPDNIIIVGTDTWSQGVDRASASPLPYSNIMYALHFYAGTHGQSLRDAANLCLSRGCAIFVSEWGTSDASGTGGPYLTQSDEWISWMNTNKLSWCNWSLCPKAETSAALVVGTSMCGPWADSQLTTSGLYVKGKIIKVTAPTATSTTVTRTATATTVTRTATATIVTRTATATRTSTTLTRTATATRTSTTLTRTATATTVTRTATATTATRTATSVSTGCTCAAGCTSIIAITPNFSKDGAGQFCYSATSLGSYINSWNLTTLNVNGVDFTNKWTAKASLPATIGGLYYVYYNSTVSYGHFEAMN